MQLGKEVVIILKLFNKQILIRHAFLHFPTVYLKGTQHNTKNVTESNDVLYFNKSALLSHLISKESDLTPDLVPQGWYQAKLCLFFL